MSNCSICRRKIESDDPAVLTMSSFGYPRHICEECEKDLDDATLSKDPEIISAAIERIGKKMQQANNDDAITLKAVTEIVENATERGEMIKNGVYDYDNDDAVKEEENEEVPEELLETEEDRELDEKEQKTGEKLDKVLNWVTLAIFIAAMGYLIYWFFTSVL